MLVTVRYGGRTFIHIQHICQSLVYLYLAALDLLVKFNKERRHCRVGSTSLRAQHAHMDNTRAVAAGVCQDMEGGDAGRGGMTNSGLLKPLGLNTIVVAERGHYWKWLCHHGRLC